MQAMGTLENPRKRPFERTFRYIGSTSVWSFSFMFFFFYLLVAISFLTDALQTANFSVLWFLVSGAAFLPPFAIGIIYRVFFLNRRRERSRPWINLLVAALAGASRNVSVGIFGQIAGLSGSGQYVFRFVGGCLMGICIFSIWAFADGARIEYQSSLRRLTETQTELSSARLQIPRHIAEINDRLQERTRQALLPQLNAIKELLGTGSNGAEAADQLRFTITEQIRPMMQEIASEQPKPFKAQNIRKFKNVSAALPARFVLHNKLQVTWSSILELFGVSLWLIVIGSKNGLLDVVALFAIYFSILSLFKFLLPNDKQFKKSIAVALSLLFALIASSANVAYIYFVLGYPNLQFLMLSGFAVLAGMTGPVILLQLTVRNERRIEIESQIKDDLRSIAKENSLFAQRLWVFRKRWLLVLHGNVQSSLTAALTRLQSAKEIDGVVIELVKQDLRRAEKAVDSSLHEKVNLANGILELQEVWQGLCEVTVSISERAKRALARNDDTSFCVNEILKEAVSNAVRHGDATEATISIDRVTDDLLQIEVINNGKPPSRNDDKRGIGTDLLDEVCLGWELENDRKHVRLIAELPVKL